eukprot:4935212-Pyramimonas_sp.AAC.1
MLHRIEQRIIRPDPGAPKDDANRRAAVLQSSNVKQCVRGLQAVADFQVSAANAHTFKHTSASHVFLAAFSFEPPQ